MYTDGRRAWDVRIALIGGAADGRALPLMGDLSLEESVAGTVALWDTDATGCARAAALGARMRREPGAGGRGAQAWVWASTKAWKAASPASASSAIR